MEYVIVSAIFWIIAASCYAVITTINFRYDVSIFSKNKWLNPAEAYRYKYRYPTLSPDTWYYRIIGVKYKERFPGSTWLFVSITDGFHAFQHVMLLSIIGAYVTLPNYINTWKEYAYVATALHLIWTLSHQILYRWLFIRKEYRH